MIKIDFIMLWVDGNDPNWQKAYNEYAPLNKKIIDNTSIRYRDWENLKYWFRGVEQFAPWVNKIHFITNGQIPEWLNTKNTKLNLVKHTDYIPTHYLPTFSSHPIELNLHRIKELSEYFVYFNDDIFITNKLSPERFFQNGLPCDIAINNALSPIDNMMHHIIANDVYCINSLFNKKEVLKNNRNKWFNIKYGSKLLRTLFLLPWPNFSGFYDPHLPNAFLKSTLEEVWTHFEEKLSQTSSMRFRSISDVNQYLFRYWQLVTGKFSPYNVNKDSTYIGITDNNINEITKCIKEQFYSIIVLNDSEYITDFEQTKKEINKALETILPKKSSFEL